MKQEENEFMRHELRLPELTVRGMLLGALLTVIFTASNVYLGLKVGLTFSSAIPAAVISMAILKMAKDSNILENNMVQTQASAAGTLSAIIFIIPGMVPHFFCGATAGIYGNATGGRKGAALGAFVNGLLITFAPALLLPVLDVFGFKNTTFGDFDFSVIGITLGRAAEAFGTTGVYAILAVLLIVAFVPNFIHTKGAVINHVEEE